MAAKKMEVKKSEKAAEAGGLPMMRPMAGYFQTLHDQLDRMFEDFASGFPFGMRMPRFPRSMFEIEPFRGVERALAPRGVMHPSVDIAESDKELTVSAELPGMTGKEVEGVLSCDMLTHKGEERLEEALAALKRARTPEAALAAARDPAAMAYAMRLAVEAGRAAFLAGRMPRREVAVPSSPSEGMLD